MRRALGTLLACLPLLAAGCGAFEGHTDGGLRPEEPTRATQVALLTRTQAGGEVTTRPTLLPDRAAVRRFVAPLAPPLQRAVLRAAARADVPEGRVLAAAVVAVGCGTPTGVESSGSGSSLRIAPTGMKDANVECFAPMTTVALVTVPE